MAAVGALAVLPIGAAFAQTATQVVRFEVSAINQIGSIIGRINEIQAHIAVSVEEQAATTMEISRVVNDVAIGSSEMSEVVGSVAETAEGTAAAMSETLIATTDLSRLSTDLENLVGAFRLS